VTARPGAASVAELVLVAWLFGCVLAGVARVVTHQNRVAALQTDRIRLEEAVRTGAIILGAEVRHADTADLRLARDSIRLRAFRGGGGVCAGDGRVLRVLYRGMRQPDPAKDSVLAVADGGVVAFGLVSATRSAACGGALELVLESEPEEPPAWVLVFETGAYVLAGGAIRYRRGQGGRQPLTEALFREMEFAPAPEGLRLLMAPDPDSLRRLPGGTREVIAPILNRPPLQ
jgi:hypothetical protein